VRTFEVQGILLVAVLIEGISVVVRRDTIDRRYKTGWPGFEANAINETLCSDTELVRVGFMSPDNIRSYIKQLERHGFVFLDSNGAVVDIVVIDQREGPTAPCNWIEFFKQEIPEGEVSAARLTGSQVAGLFCPEGWDFSRSLSRDFTFYPGGKLDENLEFVRRELGVDVYRDRRTGRESYITSSEILSEADADPPAHQEEYEALWTEAGSLVLPFLNKAASTTQEVAEATRAHKILEDLILLPDVSWRIWWALGVARRALGDRNGAYAAFSRAYGMAPDEVEVGRNLGGECIALGYGREAIAVTEAMTKIAPQDVGLVSNYALSLLIGGYVEEALRAVQRAQQLDSSDEITKGLRRMIDDVRQGKIERPTRLNT
jgi:tetratricopeptide (TPR) repeat protein